MRRFTIPQRLHGIIALGALGLIAAGAVFVWQLRDLTGDLERLDVEVRQHEQLRVMQIDLKTQVQEWKNILLRGSDRAELFRYRTAFQERSAAVRVAGESLQGSLRDPAARDLLEQFLQSHRAMDARYDAAFQQFVADGATSQRATDAMTREINRAPVALIDKIVARVNLQGSAASEVADLRREVYQVVAALAGLLVVLCIGSVMVSRSITTPLRETVRGLERVAEGDLTYRTPIVGNDEITRMNLALNTMVEQIERAHVRLTAALTATEAAQSRLAILHEIDLAILSARAPVAIAEAVLWRLRDLLGVPRAIVNVFDWEAGEVEWLAAVGRHRMYLGPGVRYPLSLAGDVAALRRGEPQIVDVDRLPSTPQTQALLASGVHVYMVVPMIVGEDLIGSVSFGGDQAQFSSEQVAIAQEIAAQLAIAMTQARLHEQIAANRDLLQAVIESAPVSIVTVNNEGVIQSWNRGAIALYGWQPEEVVGGLLPTVPSDRRGEHTRLLELYRTGEEMLGLETQRLRKDGSLADVMLSVAPITDRAGQRRGSIGITVDISQRKQLERQLLQAQKMEAIGQLAGGVAHDFNNLLTVIGGRSSLLLQRMRPDDPFRRHIELIEKTGQRAAGLTRQLLAFSRKQVLAPKPTDLSELVAGVLPMLRRLIGEHVEIVVVPGEEMGPVMADPGQLEQVVMNLVVNARDAMPDGGTVKIQTTARTVAELTAHAQGAIPPGAYVTLSVQDTGCGMDAATMQKIFEPFFTTKDPGKGTGLGLSMVHGIVHQSGGFIGVDSTPDKGTTFTLYFPRIPQATKADEGRQVPAPEWARGTETILLVEDEEDVRQLASEVLEACGYTVLHTSSPTEALGIAQKYTGAIDLLLTDMVMPGMQGPELAERLQAMTPDVCVLLVSGYTDEVIATSGLDERGWTLMQKPFTPQDLARRVRQILSRKREARN